MSQMTQTEIQRYATQVDNFYKGKGKVCLYATAGLREIKNKSPMLKLSDASILSLFLFNQENNKSVKYCLDGGDEGYILKKTEILMAQNSDLARMANSDTEGSETRKEPAYIVQIKRGKYKDMSPAEIISQKGLQALNEVAAELQQSMNNPQYVKFRAMNMEQYNACVQAYNLFQNGQLENVTTSKPYIIWKGIKTPDIKKVDQRGLTEVRMISISYTPGAEEPYEIKISNFMAPPVEGAMVGAKVSKAVDENSMYVQMNEKDWYCFWSELVNAKKAYNNYVAPGRIQFAEANAWRPDPSKRANTQNNQNYQGQQTRYGNGYQNMASY